MENIFQKLNSTAYLILYTFAAQCIMNANDVHLLWQLLFSNVYIYIYIYALRTQRAWIFATDFNNSSYFFVIFFFFFCFSPCVFWSFPGRSCFSWRLEGKMPVWASRELSWRQQRTPTSASRRVMSAKAVCASRTGWLGFSWVTARTWWVLGQSALNGRLVGMSFCECVCDDSCSHATLFRCSLTSFCPTISSLLLCRVATTCCCLPGSLLIC